MLKLSLIAILLVISPLLSTSLRPTYFYFIFNLVIIALGIEAGLLSSSSKPSEDQKPIRIATTPVTNPDFGHEKNVHIIPQRKAIKVVEKCSSDKMVSTNVVVVRNVKRSPSTPSLFFIGGGEVDTEEGEDNCFEEEEEEVVPSGHDQLFNKAEKFIGNFYKQLNMQREDSLKRIHDFYHKAF